MPGKSMETIKIFYSYAHEDELLREELEKHLSLLKHQGLITEWYDHEISAGTDWADEIDTHLNTAQIILLLISPDFIASEYCYSVEMRRAMEKHETREARIIPIILRPTDWRDAPFSRLHVLPTNGQPVSTWPNRDQAFLNIAQGIRTVVEVLRTRAFTGPSLANPNRETFVKPSQSTPATPQRFKRAYALPFTIVAILLILLVALFTSFELAPGKQRQPETTNSSSAMSCPHAGTVRQAVIRPLPSGSDQNIIYLESGGSVGNVPEDVLKRYDVKTRSESEIMKVPNKTAVVDAQLSKDGQWLLLTTEDAGQFKLQIMRVDGQMLQTLYCLPPAEMITDARWSDDQQWIVFNKILPSSQPGIMYLLNVGNGVLQPELMPESCTGYVPLTWFDKIRVYLIAAAQCASCPCTAILKLLDINKGANQQGEILHNIVGISDGGSIDISPDRKHLFVSDTGLREGPNVPSTISSYAITGGGASTIYQSSTLLVTKIRMISSTALLLLIKSSGNPNQNGLWKLQTGGSGLIQLTTDPNTSQHLNFFSQDTWSNVSRDSTMYALQASYQDNSSALLFGSLNGGPPTAFVSALDGIRLAMIGWTTM